MAIDLGMTDRFVDRHVGPSPSDIQSMLEMLGITTLDELINQTVPPSIRHRNGLNLPNAKGEPELLARLRELEGANRCYRSFIGMGYHSVVTPRAIERAILENPNWYTQYTPYQPEISQGRLEALLNFQTMIIDLTGMEIANASLLDESTAAAEAMTMFYRLTPRKDKTRFFVSEVCHPQTIAVVKARADPLGIRIAIGDHSTFRFSEDIFGALVQYPCTDGAILDYTAFCSRAHDALAKVAVAADLLSLALLEAPSSFGADAVVGTTQRFGLPLGNGGPHAGYFATRSRFRRQVPGRIIGVAVDQDGLPALRMALQMREQHIKRARATSNICTAQALPAILASAYAVFHGPQGLYRIAARIHDLTKVLAEGLERLGYSLLHDHFFDTLTVVGAAPTVRAAAERACINLRYTDPHVGIALDEATLESDIDRLLAVFAESAGRALTFAARDVAATLPPGYTGALRRSTAFLEHPVFSRYHSETALMRYMHRLASRDLSLTTSMIPLGSCTMKLNAAIQLTPLTWSSFRDIHPFAPEEQTAGYRQIFDDLKAWLAEITGFDAVSLQPNAGASGEYAGLRAIRAYHQSRGDRERDVCLVPDSAHGTNPASAVMAGMRVIVIRTNGAGNIDLDHLRTEAKAHADKLAAIMLTYPSTFGVFEEGITDVCNIVHQYGGLVYLDGANMNAQVGLCRPGDYGADVCHLNLHKTFAIPHGGGGPGMGPICVKKHLEPFLPAHPLGDAAHAVGPVSAAPYGSALILLISWAYIALLGPDGVQRASEIAILNANYVANRLAGYFPVLYRGSGGYVAHEFILDLRAFRQRLGIQEADVAKRLMDYGFHAPTMSWPVVGTIMVEPTESESKEELDRFCDAMIAIRQEIQDIEDGKADAKLNVLKQAPHTARLILSDDYDLPYSRLRAAFPAPWSFDQKFWPAVRRLNDAHGDRKLICSCPPVESYLPHHNT